MQLYTKINVLVNSLISKTFNFIYPTTCRNCEKLIQQDSIFCLECHQKIVPVVSIFLPVTNKKSIKLFAISDYKNPLKSLILKKTFSDILACKQLAKLILQYCPIKNLEIDYIVPIPLHWTRYAHRGYNQSYQMAKVLSKNLNVPVLNILKRKKRTLFQSSLSFEKRQENLKNAFIIKEKYKNLIKNKNILFIDDLCTTGATLKNGAKALLECDPKSFNAVVACRVVAK